MLASFCCRKMYNFKRVVNEDHELVLKTLSCFYLLGEFFFFGVVGGGGSLSSR